ncbi:putative Uncharacterized transporter [Glarea lozoyensis 74030]|uniref:Putative Uncharacterized transporter n=1 Tax=Glarea lozoyensis (strain ATCC 74030 / MF5533) TaxID=1104152 RepID=H0EXM9_GLAL7|nr:putative Uncharacterized transporter [Glarea lozoyensis 74030]
MILNTTHTTMAPSAAPEVDLNNDNKSQDEKRKISSEDSGSTMEGQTTSKAADAALQFVHEQAIEIDEETDKRIRRKIDWHILPWMCTLYLLQYMDKVTLSYAAVMGIKEDTHLTASQYSWTGSIFYLGYLAFEYPHNRLMQRFPVGKYVAANVIVWGAMLAATAGTTSFAGIMVVRFFLGAFEGAVTAGASIVGGALAYGIARGFRENTSITFEAWKALFIIFGLTTSLFGVGMFFFLADSPITAKWLSDEERRLAVERLRGNQQGLGSRVFKWYQVKETFTDIRTYLIFLFMVSLDIPNGGITVFFTQLIQGYGFTSEETLLISMPGGIVQLASNVGIPYMAYRLNQRYLSGCFGILCGIFGIALMAGLAMDDPLNKRIGQLVGYYMIIGNSATGLIIILGTISTNTAGYTKKTTVNAIALIGYCVGFLIGPQSFRDGPYYANAKYVMIGMWTVALMLMLALWFINKQENKRRDLQAAAEGLPPQPAGQEFLDLTDKENKYFRYAL